jgi:hypothetical protein
MTEIAVERRVRGEGEVKGGGCVLCRVYVFAVVVDACEPLAITKTRDALLCTLT